jgi:four helix bundle protein
VSEKFEKPTSYAAWLEQVPRQIVEDNLWQFETYRRALFFYDLSWYDCDQLLRHPLGRELARQLIRSSDSVSANIEEGFGRGFGRDYARFLKIALGSARETRGRYYRARALLSSELVDHRLSLLSEIISGLVSASNYQRTSASRTK